MKISDLLENAWDDFGRTEFPDEYFSDIDLNHPWMKNDFTRYGPDRFLSAFETAAFSRSPYDFSNDLFSFSAAQINSALQVHGINPGIDLNQTTAKFELIKLATRNQARIGKAASDALRKNVRPS